MDGMWEMRENEAQMSGLSDGWMVVSFTEKGEP